MITPELRAKIEEAAKKCDEPLATGIFMAGATFALSLKPEPMQRLRHGIKEEYCRVAEKIFHEWSSQESYEPMDEDMAINLVCRIRDALVNARTHPIEPEPGSEEADMELAKAYVESTDFIKHESRNIAGNAFLAGRRSCACRRK